MDPDAVFRTIIESFHHADYQQAAESARSLLTWLRTDGFPPRIAFMFDGLPYEPTSSQTQRAIAISVAEEVLLRSIAIERA